MRRHSTTLTPNFNGMGPWQRLGLISFTFLIIFLLYHGMSSTRYIELKSYAFPGTAEFVSVPVEAIMKGDPIQLPQDDPRIKKFIWDHGYLKEPSDKPYNLKEPEKDPSMGQGQLIRKLLKNVRGGFFIETGALDGETRSNTLYMEKELGWKGLLVEADPRNYALVLQKNRKAWTSNSCMAMKPYPHQVVFQQRFNVGKIQNETAQSFDENQKNVAIVQCFPLYSLLNALSITTIDYFSLDVEGVEMELLENLPFDKVFIKTLSVEFSHVPKGKDYMKTFMESKGYIVAGEITNSMGLANDFIFVHHTLSYLINDLKL